jgi:hypothetical protein
MRKARILRYGLLTLMGAFLLAITGLIWAHRSSLAKGGRFHLQGRYVSAETAYDVSTVHLEGDTVGPPVFFAATAVMEADGKGNVSGESDGFYGGTPSPGVNLGPAWFKGVYTIDPNGRVEIDTCSTGTAGFFADTTPCDFTGATAFKTQVGYLQDGDGKTLTTVEQINVSDPSFPPHTGCCATTGFLVHARVWTKGASREDDHD